MLRYRSLFSFLARANRAGWSGIVYRSESDIARDVVDLLEKAVTVLCGDAKADTRALLEDTERSSATRDLLLNIDGIIDLMLMV